MKKTLLSAGAILLVAGVLVGRQWPEIKRYVKMTRM